MFTVPAEFFKVFYRSTNAGASWTLTLNLFDASSLVMSSSNSQVLFLSSGYYEGYYNGSKIYKSINGGVSWTLLTGGISIKRRQNSACYFS